MNMNTEEINIDNIIDINISQYSKMEQHISDRINCSSNVNISKLLRDISLSNSYDFFS